MVFIFKIQLIGITKPPVWRRVSVPAYFTFVKFHEVIQTAFGWSDSHLFEFKDKERLNRISISQFMGDALFYYDFSVTHLAEKTKLIEFFLGWMKKMVYVHDFGDNLTHKITLESTTDDTDKTAKLLAGRETCPPEDCGGLYGYE